jgi:hypothetical protein
MKCYYHKERKFTRKIHGVPMCDDCYIVALEHCADLDLLGLLEFCTPLQFKLKAYLAGHNTPWYSPGRPPLQLEVQASFQGTTYTGPLQGRPTSKR